MQRKNRIKSLIKGILGVFRLRLIDPYEVFFDIPSNTFYPIVSKSGCTSVKNFLIRQYDADSQLSFPEIHKIDPSKLTGGKLERYMFYSKSAYLRFSHGKHMRLIIRNPVTRFFSCYTDVNKGKNTLYEHPSGLDWLVKTHRNDSVETFIKQVCRTPDYLSDRHFRSQAFYFPKNFERHLKGYEIVDLEGHGSPFKSGAANSDDAVKLNTNVEKATEKNIAYLQNHKGFQNRYKRDIELFDSISGK